MTVHDDGTSSNEDRLARSAISALTIDRARLAGEDLFVVAGDNSSATRLPDYVDVLANQRRERDRAVRGRRPELLKGYGVVELDDDDRVIGFEEKPAQPKSHLAATAAYLYLAKDLDLLGAYLEEGNPPDAPGNFVAWLHTRAPVHGYRFAGEWHDIGDLGQLLEADNRLRERAGMPFAANTWPINQAFTKTLGAA